MSWLDEMMSEITRIMPKDGFADRSGGLKDVRRVVDVVEDALKRRDAETAEASRISTLRAAADPSHDWLTNPVFAPTSVELWKAMETFPRILRNAMLIAAYSQLEYLLLSWCESVAVPGRVAFADFPPRQRKEPHPRYYLRYLRDGAGLRLGNFTRWPEWQPLNAYRVVRNCLAHNSGIVRESHHRAAVGSLPHVAIDDSVLALHEPAIHLLPGACEAAVDLMMAFIERALSTAGL